MAAHDHVASHWYYVAKCVLYRVGILRRNADIDLKRMVLSVAFMKNCAEKKKGNGRTIVSMKSVCTVVVLVHKIELQQRFQEANKRFIV